MVIETRTPEEKRGEAARLLEEASRLEWQQRAEYEQQRQAAIQAERAAIEAENQRRVAEAMAVYEWQQAQRFPPPLVVEPWQQAISQSPCPLCGSPLGWPGEGPPQSGQRWASAGFAQCTKCRQFVRVSYLVTVSLRDGKWEKHGRWQVEGRYSIE